MINPNFQIFIHLCKQLTIDENIEFFWTYVKKHIIYSKSTIDICIIMLKIRCL